MLVTKTIRAAEATGARSIVLGGGVAANGALRARLAGEAEARGLPLIVPRPALCTDNGAMIGAAGARRFRPASGPAWPSTRGRRCRSPGDDRRAAAASTGAGPPGSTRPTVRRTLRDAGLRARHALSQNFLADPEVLEAILAEAAPTPGRASSRSGPGSGFLTGGLLEAGAAVTAVELDRGLAGVPARSVRRTQLEARPRSA